MALTAAEKNARGDPFDLVCRFKTASAKKRIDVPKEQAKGFTQSLLNVYRLNCFKKKGDGRSRKIAKPSQKNPKSKKSLKQKERVKRFKVHKEQAKKLRVETKQKKEFLFKLAKGAKEGIKAH